MRHDIGTFALLRVTAVQDIGTFLDWGQPQELFLPLREQEGEVHLNEEIVVYITLDRSQRPIASMRLDEFLEPDGSALRPEQRVQLLVIDESDLGFTAIINHRHVGILYHSEVFQPLSYGSQLPGYVKKIREDGKVDLILQPTGMRGASDLGQQIVDKIKAHGGFLALTEKSPPEEIYRLFGVSKKKFKIALGGIYKAQQVSLHEDGIRLTP